MLLPLLRFCKPSWNRRQAVEPHRLPVCRAVTANSQEKIGKFAEGSKR